MNKKANNKIFTYFRECIINFENKIFKEKDELHDSGVIYTPEKITNFIVLNIFKIFIDDLGGKNQVNIESNSQNKTYFNSFKLLLNKHPEIKEKVKPKIQKMKILDPACGSGRFLTSAAEVLLLFYKVLYPELTEYKMKKKIVQNNLYGIEIERSAQIISKIKLMLWLFSDNITAMKIDEKNLEKLELNDIEQIFDENEIKFNIYDLDFLLDFDLNKEILFDFIIGNPPYIENKKINLEYKKKLYENFKSAYKLFDLSIIFIERSIGLLKENGEGYLSFILTNKFLAADYGIKIRKLLIKNTEIKKINNISSLSIFRKTAAYPIILSLRKGLSSNNHLIKIENYDNLDSLFELNNSSSIILPQNFINKLPGYVIPISGEINKIRYLYSNFRTMQETINDLKIIYRPYGFTKWAKFFENVSESKNNEKDLILVGTGNVGKYYIQFDKRIKIAKKDLTVSYFRYNEATKDIWKELNCEKLIFREIAKDLTCVYDPGVFTNITGLYFIKVPSFNSNKLFCLLAILNSNLMNIMFKTLFGTLHMSGGYLRFNGSFIKRLPMPEIEEFPISLSYLGKMNQFLTQLKYDCQTYDVDKFLEIIMNLTDSLVYALFLHKKIDLRQNYPIIDKLLRSPDLFPDIQFKYFNTRFNLQKFKIYQKEELKSNLDKIYNLSNKISENKDLLDQMELILKKESPLA